MTQGDVNAHPSGPAIEVVIRRLQSFAPLTNRELEAVRALSGRTERLAPGVELLAEGVGVGGFRFLVAGWASRQRILSDGRRQIFDFLLPGDAIGYCARDHAVALSAAVAVTPVTVVDAEPIREGLVSGALPNVARALGLAGGREEALLLDQIVRLGRQTAYERMAHFLLSLRARLAVVGLADERRFAMPLTQETLADCLGLSIVHVNRTLQQLRRERLIEVRGGGAILLEPQLLATISDFRITPLMVEGVVGAA